MINSMKKAPKVNEEDDLLFDELGIPHGDARVQVLSTLGTIVRSKAPVWAPSWTRDVPPDVKDLIFKDLRVLHTSLYIVYMLFY